MIITKNCVIRIITAEGPCQLLNAISVLRYQKSKIYAACDDILVIGWLSITDSKVYQDCLSECYFISSLWNFKKIVVLPDEIFAIKDKKSRTEKIKSTISLDSCHIIYTCTNWHPFDQVILDIYNKSFKVCYGDGFGLLDLQEYEISGINVSRNNYCSIDLAILFVPIIYKNSLNYIKKIEYPNFEYLYQTLLALYELKKKSSQTIARLQNYIKNFDEPIFVTTSWLSESGLIKPKWLFHTATLVIIKVITKIIKILSLFNLNLLVHFLANFKEAVKKKYNNHLVQSEVEIYYQTIVSNEYYSANKEKTIFVIKSHPRETMSQGQRLQERLTQSKYNAILVDSDLKYTLSEVFAVDDIFKSYECLGSTSAFTIKQIVPHRTVYHFMNSDCLSKKSKISYSQDYIDFAKVLYGLR